MAEYIEVKDIVGISDYPNSFRRGGAFPLDYSTLFNTLAEAQTYALTDGKAYVGQPLVVAIGGSAWAFSDEGTHTITWNNTTSKWVLDAGESSEEESAVSDVYAVSVEFTTAGITATRATAPSVEAYVIGPEGTLIQQSSSSEAHGDIDAAISALDSSVTASSSTAAVTNVDSPVAALASVTETDGKLTAMTAVRVDAYGAAKQAKLDSAITVDEVDDELSAGILKQYKIYQGGTKSGSSATVGGSLVGTIDIPKDFLVKSAQVVQAGSTKDDTTVPPTRVIPNATAGARYIEFIINAKDESETESPLYLSVEDLYDSYTSDDTSATPIQIVINNTTNKISAVCNIAGTATIATVSDGVVTLKAGLTQSSGVVSNNSSSDITLAKVATTGAAVDVSVAADATSGLTAGTVQGTLQDLKTAISNNVVSILQGDTDGTIKWKNASDLSYTEITPKNLKAVATTGAAANVSIADAGSVVEATTVEGAIQEIATEIDGMDLSATALATVDENNVITINGISETDGKVSVLTDTNKVTITAETALTGDTAKSDYVSVSASSTTTGTNTAVSIASKVKVQPVSTATELVKGLAEAYDVKSYVDSSASSKDIDIGVGTEDGTIKWKKGSGSYVNVKPLNLKTVATTGLGSDVAYTVSGDTVTESVTAALTRLDGSDSTTGSVSKKIKDAIDGLDSSVSATAADGNQYSVLTGVTEADGKLTAKTEVKLAAVAKTGTAADVAIVDSDSKFTATNVETALAELKTDIGNNVVDIQQGSSDGTIKWKNASDLTYTEITPKNLKTVATTGAAEHVSVSDSTLVATNVKAALVEIATEIDNMDATTTASTASEDTSAIQGISVVTDVTQTDGVVAMTTAKADKYGSASKAKADVIGASTDASSANTIYGAKAYADGLDSSLRSALAAIASVSKITDLPTKDNCTDDDVWEFLNALKTALVALVPAS